MRHSMTIGLLADGHQADLLAGARHARLVREATGGTGTGHGLEWTRVHPLVTMAASALLAISLTFGAAVVTGPVG